MCRFVVDLGSAGNLEGGPDLSEVCIVVGEVGPGFVEGRVVVAGYEYSVGEFEAVGSIEYFVLFVEVFVVVERCVFV